jgi:hypothetical protein
VPALEDVERLLFENDLLVLRKVVRELCSGLVRDGDGFSANASGTSWAPAEPRMQCGGNCANSGSSNSWTQP